MQCCFDTHSFRTPHPIIKNKFGLLEEVQSLVSREAMNTNGFEAVIAQCFCHVLKPLLAARVTERTCVLVDQNNVFLQSQHGCREVPTGRKAQRNLDCEKGFELNLNFELF